MVECYLTARFNYKKKFSIVFLALVDANCEFLVVEAGANGRVTAVSYTHLDVYKRQVYNFIKM